MRNISFSVTEELAETFKEYCEVNNTTMKAELTAFMKEKGGSFMDSKNQLLKKLEREMDKAVRESKNKKDMKLIVNRLAYSSSRGNEVVYKYIIEHIIPYFMNKGILVPVELSYSPQKVEDLGISYVQFYAIIYSSFAKFAFLEEKNIKNSEYLDGMHEKDRAKFQEMVEQGLTTFNLDDKSWELTKEDVEKYEKINSFNLDAAAQIIIDTKKPVKIDKYEVKLNDNLVDHLIKHTEDKADLIDSIKRFIKLELGHLMEIY